MTIKLKKKPKKEASKKEEIDTDFLHWVARQVYCKGLIRGGSPNYTMKSDKIDSNCSLYKPAIKDALNTLIEHGIISMSDLKIPLIKK